MPIVPNNTMEDNTEIPNAFDVQISTNKSFLDNIDITGMEEYNVTYEEEENSINTEGFGRSLGKAFAGDALQQSLLASFAPTSPQADMPGLYTIRAGAGATRSPEQRSKVTERRKPKSPTLSLKQWEARRTGNRSLKLKRTCSWTETMSNVSTITRYNSNPELHSAGQDVNLANLVEAPVILGDNRAPRGYIRVPVIARTPPPTTGVKRPRSLRATDDGLERMLTRAREGKSPDVNDCICPAHKSKYNGQ